MFNLLAGQGLGFTGSKLIALGLNPITEYIIPPIKVVPNYDDSSSVGGTLKKVIPNDIVIRDNAYSIQIQDDTEIVEILSIIFEVL